MRVQEEVLGWRRLRGLENKSYEERRGEQEKRLNSTANTTLSLPLPPPQSIGGGSGSAGGVLLTGREERSS